MCPLPESGAPATWSPPLSPFLPARGLFLDVADSVRFGVTVSRELCPGRASRVSGPLLWDGGGPPGASTSDPSETSLVWQGLPCACWFVVLPEKESPLTLGAPQHLAHSRCAGPCAGRGRGGGQGGPGTPCPWEGTWDQTGPLVARASSGSWERTFWPLVLPSKAWTHPALCRPEGLPLLSAVAVRAHPSRSP